ncbi:unnamed protein product [Rotaria magnacalcarata]|uniref:NHL repeat protein n=2 Tax=Rotaria magnacalcarata TaxID=392030 RepID=A0A8S3DA16_9BILA|nr:unnamed protein product [Rotaria magnacalcarata]
MFSLLVNIPANAKWAQKGVTIAGGNRRGGATNQLNGPCGLFVDDDQTVVITDFGNNRIIQWENGGNQRVVRWSHGSGTTQREILIDNIDCSGLAMDEQRYLYVSDARRNEVRRYQSGEKNGTLVAGGNGKGGGLNQFNDLHYLFVDRDHSVYVSDWRNHRVMKWVEGAKEGIVVAGGQGAGSALTQLYYPYGIFVDVVGALYVADYGNDRVMRWTQGDKKQGTVIVGGNGSGARANQLCFPVGLSFDRHGNLYVADQCNNRVQRFSID